MALEQAFEQLRSHQQDQGARFGDAPGAPPLDFGEPAVALAAARDGVAVSDRSHWGRIAVSGNDRLSFLHNQSTNDFKSLQPSQGCETVFVTATARTIDLATAYVGEAEVQLLVSPSRRDALLALLDRYIFFGDGVELTDITETQACFSLIGPQSSDLVAQLSAKDLSGLPLHSHRCLSLGGVETRVAQGSGLGLPGYTLLCPADQALALWQQLCDASAIPLGQTSWEQLRIQQGRPAPDQELTEEYNPLEAGLWQTISFDKGCYIGQETIARLNTYNGVKQRLWGLQLSAPAAPGSAILLGEAKVGKLTSLAETPAGLRGLGYIRTKAGGAGLQVQVGEGQARVIPLEYVLHPDKAKPEGDPS